MTKDEHIAWCKERAMTYLPAEPRVAFMSMLSDMNKHEETRNHPEVKLGLLSLVGGFTFTSEEVRKWIEGFGGSHEI